MRITAAFTLLFILSAGNTFADDRVVPLCIMENDLQFKEDCFSILQIPSHVKDALPKVLDKLWNDTLWDRDLDLENDISPTLQRFRLSRKYYLWVYGIYIESAKIRRLYLLLENTRAKIVMEKIHGLDFSATVRDNNTDWNKGFLKGKLIEIKDVDDDGENEIVIQRRVHKGTRENAAGYSYYKIVSDELENIFNYYTRELTVSDKLIIREVKFINKGKRNKFIDMGVYLKKDKDDDKLIGSVRFTISDDKKRYVKTDESLYDKEFEKEILAHGSDNSKDY